MIVDWLMERIDRWAASQTPQMGFVYDLELRPRFKWPVTDHAGVMLWPIGRPFTTDPQH